MNTYIETYTKRYGRLLFSLSGLLLLLALTGCRDSVFERDGVDPAGVDCPSVTEGQEQEVQIPYLLPSAETMKPGTRALKVEDESTLDANKCRLFVLSGDKSAILYEGTVKSITPPKDDHPVGSISATLKPSTTPVTVVFVANLPETALSQAVSTVADLGKLSFGYPTDGAYTLLPAWGEVQLASISATGGTATETLHLLRSVARIDVGLNMTMLENNGAKDPDFSETSQPLTGIIYGVEVPLTLSHTRLYNFSKTGLVAPAAANYDVANHKVSQPSLPAGTSNTTIAMADYSSKISANLLRREIYVPETANDNGTSTTIDKRPFLVVGLDYTEGEATKTTYYRIDFLARSNARKYAYLPLLRNYRYKVNILEVYAPGFDTPDEAAKAPATRLRYEVMAWQESEMGKVAYDGPYTLSVDEDVLKVGRYGSLQDIGIKTTWPKGWSVEIPTKLIDPKTGKEQTEDNTLAKWVDFEGLTEGKPTNKEATNLVLNIKKQEPDAQGAVNSREGCFLIRAGRMTRLVRVHQSGEADLEIAIFSDPEAKVPLQFIELSQRGLKAKSVDEQGNPLPLPGYRRFYVRTEPYFDPNTVSDIIPFLSHAGSDHFLFYNYGENHFKETSYDFATADAKSLEVGDGNSYSPVWADPEDYKDPESARFFRYTGRDNVWECVVTAPVMHRNMSEGDPSFFERRVNTYYANLQVKDQPSTRVYADLRLLQAEYNVVPYFDKELTDCMILPDYSAFAIMDGATHTFYMTGNTPYTLKYVGAKSDMNGTNDLLSDPDVGKTSLHDFEGAKYISHKFTTAKDFTDLKRFHGYAEYEVSSPNGLFDPYTFHIELASAIEQPEANTYLIKANSKVGLLIPVSQVNRAADYYNWLLDYDCLHSPTPLEDLDAAVRQRRQFIGNTVDIRLHRLDQDDDFEPWLIWTDMGAPTARKDGTFDLSTGGISRLRSVSRSVSGVIKRYIYVLPSGDKMASAKKRGNALIGIRSSKILGSPNLWSWHIWMVDEYPKMVQTEDKDGIKSNWVLDRNLGADFIGSQDDCADIDAMGFAYQWGRKDPFPWPVQVVEINYKPGRGYEKEDLKTFWDGQGHIYSFPDNQRGTRSNRGQNSVADGRGATMTMRESVEWPAIIVSHQSVWMTEHLPFYEEPKETLFNRATWKWIWEMATTDETGDGFLTKPLEKYKSDRNDFMGRGRKSPFDPSPYGMRLPKYDELKDISRLVNSSNPAGTHRVRTATLYDGNYYNLPSGPAKFNWDPFGGAPYSDKDRLAAPIPRRYGGTLDSNGDRTEWRRCNGVAIRPVVDVPHYARRTVTQQHFDNITKYWPGYKKP